MLYIISDHHFGHANIIKYCNRPFDGVIQNAEFMYNEHQKIVKDDDVVVFLGDIALFRNHTKTPFKNMFNALKGKKFLVLGNHDNMPIEFYKECGFLDVREYHVIDDVMLCHYPLEKDTYRQDLRKILLENATTLYHGHIHEKNSTNEDSITRINCCVEKTNYVPLLLENKKIEDYFNSLIDK